MRRSIVLWTVAPCVLLSWAAFPATATGAERIRSERVKKLLMKQQLVRLKGVRVSGNLRLPRGVALHARNVTFEGRVVADEEQPPVDRPSLLILVGSRFQGPVTVASRHFTTLDCRGCTFEQDVDLHSNFIGPPRGDGVEVDSPPDVGSLRLDGARFEGLTDLAAMRIKGKLSLGDTRFDESANLAATRIGTFEGARIRSRQPIVIGWSQFGDEWEKRERERIAEIEDRDNREGHVDQQEQELRYWRRNFTELGIDEDAREAN